MILFECKIELFSFSSIFGGFIFFHIIRLLLAAEADPNAVDEDGNASLHVVARLRQELVDSTDLFVFL